MTMLTILSMLTKGKLILTNDNINIRHVRDLGANDEELSASRNQLNQNILLIFSTL